MKNIITGIQKFLLKHIHNVKLQSAIRATINYEIIIYVVFGVLASALDYAIYALLTYLGMDTLIANLISSICTIFFAYITNKLWVFQSKFTNIRETLSEFLKFSEARIATLIMSEVILLISKLLRGNPYIAKIIAMVLTVLLNYILSKYFIFTSKQKGSLKNEE